MKLKIYKKEKVIIARILLVVILSQNLGSPILNISYNLNASALNISSLKVTIPDLCSEISINKVAECKHDYTKIEAIKKIKKLRKSVNFKNEGGGPSTPEVQGFKPAGANDMVNLFTGEFSYNIPLLDVGGYPINISYSSNLGPNDEASWVGLGWNLSAGAIQRNVRGLPDDFDGNIIVKKAHMKKKEVISVGLGIDVQVSGLDVLQGVKAGGGGGISLHIESDNYEGFSTALGINAGFNIGGDAFGGSLGLNAGVTSRKGGYLNPNLSLSAKVTKNNIKTTMGASIGMNVNSREGLKALNFGTFTSVSLRNKVNRNTMSEFHSLPGASSSYPLTFSYPNFVPPSEMRTKNLIGAAHLNVGGEVGSVHLNGELSGSYYSQEIDTIRTLKSYGYMYLQNSDDNSLLDFNREKDGPYINEAPNLPITSTTYDVFNVSGQGIGGTFRAFRSDIGTFHDPTQNTTTTSISGGVEIGAGAVVHVGGDLNVEVGNDYVTKWKNGNSLEPFLKFQDTSVNDISYEPFYFKMMGEKTPMVNETKFNQLNGFEPVQAELTRRGAMATGDASATLNNGTRIDEISDLLNQKRENRNTLITFQTNDELTLQSQKFKHATNELRTLNPAFTPTTELGNQIGSIELTNPMGNQYVYAQPAYNNFIKEVSFNSNSEADRATGLINYTGTQNSIQNQIEDQFYQSNYIPTHAYAWLITSILSPNYQDFLNDGPTPDDNGNYTKFTYIKKHENYLWRTPYELNKANFQEGYEHTALDNKGNYVYGGKEIFYLDSIISRNYIAKFYSSPRNDSRGVLNENGGMDRNQQLNKLDSIELFTYSEAIKTRDKRPLKTVHFEYNYSLCKEDPSSLNEANPNQNGKLTLIKIWFTNGDSKKQQLSPYKFNYYNKNVYCHKAIDRWSNYKPNSNDAFTNDRFPYVQQNDKKRQDNYASEWLMNSVQLPSGGNISVQYESNDYAYVQDKPAMSMVKIKGIKNSTTGRLDSILYRGSACENINSYLYFEIDPQIYNERNVEKLYEYFKNIENLYFNVNVKITNNPTSIQPYEPISGFIPIHLESSDFTTLFGFGSASEANMAWLKLPVIQINGEAEVDINHGAEYNFGQNCMPGIPSRHPFTQAAFEFIRVQLPHLINNLVYDGSYTNIGDAFKQMGESFNEVFRTGPDTYLFNYQRCATMKADGSFIRLNHPTGYKLGGGARVKLITMSDNWEQQQIPSAPRLKTNEYSFIYEYKDNNKSSGVAEYEPMIGGDENPFALPVKYRIAKPLAADVNLWQMEPTGEIFFPGANVGYSKVTQYNLWDTTIHRTGAGKTITEFYTAKDFPVITKQTSKSTLNKNVFLPSQIFDFKDLSTAASQGFVVETNNMHGQSKATAEYDVYGVQIKKTSNIYQMENGRLSNYITTASPITGNITRRLAGIDYDMIVDARNYYTEVNSGGLQLNIDVLTPCIPIIVPIPAIGRHSSQYRGITFTKSIHRTGILQSTITTNLGASITSENELYDEFTGSVISVNTDNEFGNKYHAVAIPSYWSFQKMGPSSSNINLKLKKNITNGQFQIPNEGEYFNQGDVLMLKNIGSSTLSIKAWVLKVVDNMVYLINGAGQNLIPNATYIISVIHSGKKNFLSGSVFNFIHQDNVITTETGGLRKINLNPSSILSSNATKYSDYWQTDVGYVITEQNGECNCRHTEPAKYFSNRTRSQSNISNIINSYAQIWDLLKIVAKANRDSLIRLGFNVSQNRIEVPAGECSFILATKNGEAFISNPTVTKRELPEEASNSCHETDYMFIEVTNGIKNQWLTFQTNCYPLVKCEGTPDRINAACGTGSALINPFINGIIGNYMPLCSYTPLTKRVHTSALKDDGFLENYKPYWIWSANGLTENLDKGEWIRSDSITVLNSFGQLLESVNSLNISQSSNFGFGRLVTEAVSNDANYFDIAYDSYEDYNYNTYRLLPSSSCSYPQHFTFDRESDLHIAPTIDNSVSHSGNNSLAILASNFAEYKFKVNVRSPMRSERSDRFLESTFNVFSGDFIKPFSPKSGKYLLSVWVKDPALNSPNLRGFIEPVGVTININGVSYSPSGPIIDGWQQVNAVFEIPSSMTNSYVRINNGRMSKIWIDDLRIHPINANMVTYVYDERKLRIDAVQNELNFTQFYEYDNEGNLARTKKETEFGVFTINEVKSQLPVKK